MKKATLIFCTILSASLLSAQNKSGSKSESNKDKKIETIKIIDGDTVYHDVRMVSNDQIEERKRMKMEMHHHEKMNEEAMSQEMTDEIETLLEEIDIYVNLDERKKKMIVKRMMMKEDDIDEILKSVKEDEDLILDMKNGKKQVRVIKIEINEENGEELKVIEIHKDDHERNAQRNRDREEERRERSKRPDPLKIYPNPANEELNLTFEVIEGKPAEVVVMDMDGEKVFSKTYREAGTIDEIVDLKNKKKGMYVVRLIDVNRTISKTIIVE